jgi:hypothetical protein
MRVTLFCLLFAFSQACSISREKAFKCLLKDKCLSKVQIYRKTRLKSRLQSTYILAKEGSKYEKLFDDCDSDLSGCLDMADISASSTSCTRSCRWLKTIVDLTC